MFLKAVSVLNFLKGTQVIETQKMLPSLDSYAIYTRKVQCMKFRLHNLNIFADYYK